jgi:mRNA interferase MazF
MSAGEPSRSDIWDLNLDPAPGHKQAGTRPALILSEDLFNEGPAGLVVVAPIARAQGGVRWHVAVAPAEGGLVSPSFIQCENVRSVSRQRFKRWRGRVSEATMQQVEDRLRILMGL